MYFDLQPFKMPQSVLTEHKREVSETNSLSGCWGSYPRPKCSEDRSTPSPIHHEYPNNNTGKMCLCAGCGGPIEDRYYLLAADRQWHTGCLRCCECKIPLDNELTCFAKDGEIYCKEHYFRRFGIRQCARCCTGIAAHELVMRARDSIYHLACFNCTVCNLALTTGDYFGMRDSQVYCRLHYETTLTRSPGDNPQRHNPQRHPRDAPCFTQQQPGLVGGYHGPLTPGPSPPACPTSGPPATFYNGMGVSVHKGRPRKRKGMDSVGEYCRGLGGVDGHLGLDSDGYVTQQSQRTKRMRTSFKHHQLRAMKSYFSINHNPDAKDLKQLAQKTGLTKRVLQVWFQNARAKFRRSLVKKEQGGSDKSVGSPSSSGDAIHGNPIASPNGRSSSPNSTTTTDGVSSHHGCFDTSSGSEQGSIILGSPGADSLPSYSELKNASELSPAVADDVLTISAMPAPRSPPGTSALTNDCLPSPNALNGSMLKTNLIDIF